MRYQEIYRIVYKYHFILKPFFFKSLYAFWCIDETPSALITSSDVCYFIFTPSALITFSDVCYFIFTIYHLAKCF